MKYYILSMNILSVDDCNERIWLISLDIQVGECPFANDHYHIREK